MPEDFYFPAAPADSMALEWRFREIVKHLSETERCKLYEILAAMHSYFHRVDFTLEETVLLAHQEGQTIAFPRPLPIVKFSHLLCGYEHWLERKYSLPGFLTVEDNDVVIDCGAYVGGFSLSASKRARSLHAFEPETENFACLTANLSGRQNVILNQVGLYSASQTMDLNISRSGVEHSLLTPDDGEVIERRPIEVISLKDYCIANKISVIDFLKLEAEGVELEIFEGLGHLRPRKIAIDVSPEREGKSPANDFLRQLGLLGYEIRQRGHVMFAKHAL